MVRFSPEAVRQLGGQLATKNPDGSIDLRTFVAFYGTSPEVLSECWDNVRGKVEKAKPKHLLWACMFMKLYLPEDVMCVLLDTSKPTFKKWAWEIMESLSIASVDVIKWENRKRNLPANAIACISVDGTDFKVQEPFPFNPKMKSHKYNGAALKYEVAISIYSGDIVWVYGPHRGAKHDLTIFREKLKAMLDEGEMAEADQGYIGEAEWIRAKYDYGSKEERKEKGRVRNCTETCNHRFKCWTILKMEYRHSLDKHGIVFHAIAGITQVGIDLGGCLFGNEPKSVKPDRPYSIKDIDLEEFVES